MLYNIIVKHINIAHVNMFICIIVWKLFGNEN